MPFPIDLKEKISDYVNLTLPTDEWYENNLFTFISEKTLRARLITEHKNARIIYKFFEGLGAEDDLLLAQIKTQVIMYVSIQEAIINYVLFELHKENPIVQMLLTSRRLKPIDIPTKSLDKLEKELHHDKKDIICCFYSNSQVDKTKIRFENKLASCVEIGIISKSLELDLKNLYEYRNTVHLEAELRKNLNFDLEMGELAYRRVEGLSMSIDSYLKELSSQ